MIRPTQAVRPTQEGSTPRCCLAGHRPKLEASGGRLALRGHVSARPQSLPAGLASEGSPRADVHVVVLVLGLLLHRQLLQSGVHVQLVRLQLPEQRLSLEEGAETPSALCPHLASP